jgi:deoxyguanosine kinase
VIIAIEGCIGAGKTTSAAITAGRLGARAVLEQTDKHPFLAAFYEDPKRFALETELGFVLLHYHQLHPVDRNALVVADFSPAKDLVFARMNLAREQLALFEHVYERLVGGISEPALAIYLDIDAASALRRIRQRDRPYERQITLDYLLALKAAYSAWLPQLGRAVERLEVDSTESRESIAERVIVAIERSGILG